MAVSYRYVFARHQPRALGVIVGHLEIPKVTQDMNAR